ncbi:MAG TPA: ferritin-like domain-containing protein, partial [Solirubrobacteraceae bacterium]|nr:ferritin-like domain-containing protein [Solirubrobacteraceae bacterium]
MSDRLSRRRFLRLSGAGAAGGSAGLLAACGDGGGGPAVAPGPDESDQADIEILNGVLDLELRAIEAYKTGAAQLTGSALEVVKRFLAQEQEHADGLSQAIEDMGGTPNEPKASYDFPQLRSQRDVLRFA